jgi:CheY-like chemotaxis protein
MEFKSHVKALIVDDSRVDALILSAILRRFHVEITVAENGKAAVDLFLEGKKFDIVLCDKEMPVMTGPEVF